MTARGALFYAEWTKIAGTVFVTYPENCISRLLGK